MSFKITIKPSVDFGSINVLDKGLMKFIALKIKQNIVEKNESGLDVFGSPHKGYSTNPLNVQTEFGLKGGRIRKLGLRAQRRNQLTPFEKAFVDSGGIGRPGSGAGTLRGSILKKIREAKVFVPAPPTKGPDGRQMTFKHYPGGYNQYKQEVFGSSVVNHRNTGRMMDSLKHQARSAKRAKVWVSKRNEARAGAKNQVEFGRHWFGIGDRRMKTLKLIFANIRFNTRFYGSGRRARLNKISGISRLGKK